jgi:PAS domain S-box-containing protein
MLLVMSYELGRDLLRSRTLEHDLQETQFQLHDSEERLRLAAEAVGLGFWSRKLKGDAFWATARAKSMLGLDPNAPVTFATFQANLHPEDRPALEAGMAAALEGKGGFRAECRLCRPGGDLSWLSIRGDVTAHREGRPASLTGMVVDISERRRSELEIARQRRELGHLARVNMLGELSGSIAHELNQPLTAILSNAQAAQNYLASDRANLEEVREILGDIVAEDKRASQIIRGLRSLLKQDTDDSSSEANEMNDVVLEVLKLMRSDFLNQGVTVHTELASALPAVLGARVQLQQVLINLLMNACDAMAYLPPADRQVRLATGIDVGGGVHISVTDQGPGIPPDKLEKIFEPFYTNKPSGMGLGLAVCRTIVTAHNGRIWASHGGEGGATFHLTLPGKNLAPAGR